LSKVEVDEMTSLMGHIASEIPSNDTMPCGIVFLVKLLLDECGNVLKHKFKIVTHMSYDMTQKHEFAQNSNYRLISSLKIFLII